MSGGPSVAGTGSRVVCGRHVHSTELEGRIHADGIGQVAWLRLWDPRARAGASCTRAHGLYKSAWLYTVARGSRRARTCSARSRRAAAPGCPRGTRAARRH